MLGSMRSARARTCAGMRLACRTQKLSRWCATSSSREWRVDQATRAAVERHAESLAGLDADLRAELGAIYSDESWTEREFLAERPAKWLLSRLAIHGEELCGFWIASIVGVQAHTHRVGVSAQWRGRGVMNALAEEVHRAAHIAGALRMTLYLNPENHVAREAYRRLGYRACILEGRGAMERRLCE
jgi:GNAT superfamily N-acetyltransferase